MNNFRSIRKNIAELKEYSNFNDDSLYDFIRKHPNYYLLLFQTYLRKNNVEFMDKIRNTVDLLDSGEFKDYREDFEKECKEISLKDFIKR